MLLFYFATLYWLEKIGSWGVQFLWLVVAGGLGGPMGTARMPGAQEFAFSRPGFSVSGSVIFHLTSISYIQITLTVLVVSFSVWGDEEFAKNVHDIRQAVWKQIESPPLFGRASHRVI